ncbi:MAG: glycosyltransferase family 2 protein [Chloroflexota bacterium]|jgi:GT2 family glycosyltransferase
MISDQSTNTNKPLVYISVLNWNGADNTIRCLESLEHLDYPNCRILVVDNASMDDSVARIQAAFPDIEIICSPENLGYAGGNRLALDRAMQDGAELFWILNNDAIAKPDALMELVKAYQYHGLAIYGSVVLKPDEQNLVAFGGGYQLDINGRPRATGKYNSLRDQPYDKCFSHQHDRTVGAVNGSSLMIPIRLVEKYGFMDDVFFMNVEEVDYCFRLGRRGVPSIIVPKSIIVHMWGGSYRHSSLLSCVMHYYLQRNQLIFIRRWEGRLAFVKQLYGYFRNSWRFQVMAIIFPRKAWIRDPRAYMARRAVLDAILNRMGKRFAPEDYLVEIPRKSDANSSHSLSH